MAKKKRPSLKDYLSTGQVVAGDEMERAAPLEETLDLPPAEAPSPPKKRASAARKPGRGVMKRKKAAPDGDKDMPEATEAPLPDSAAGEKTAAEERETPSDAAAEASSPERGEGGAAAGKPREDDARATEAGSDSVFEQCEGLRLFVGLLCDEDRKTWEKIFAAARTEFLPLDFIERREDFRTMDRSRFTLFKLEEAGKPLFHVRTSVQIREPLIALLKWDETGKAAIYRP